MPKQYPTRASLHRSVVVADSTPVSADVPAPVTTPRTPLPTRAELRRAAEAAAAQAIQAANAGPVTPPWIPVTPAAASNSAPAASNFDSEPTTGENLISRSDRRADERRAKETRNASLVRAAHTSSLAVVAGALIASTVVIDPISIRGDAPLAADNTGDSTDSLGLTTLGRSLAASRSGVRGDQAPAAEVTPADAADTAANQLALDEAAEAAEDALSRVAQMVDTEARTTPEQREDLISHATVLRELINIARIGQMPDPEYAELTDAVYSALSLAVVQLQLEASYEDPTSITSPTDFGEIEECAEPVEHEDGSMHYEGCGCGGCAVYFEDTAVLLTAINMFAEKLQDLVDTAVSATVEVDAKIPFEFGLPIDNPDVSSPFGFRHFPVRGHRNFGRWIMHYGVDFRASCGTPIFASQDGVVTESGFNGSIGNHITIDHGIPRDDDIQLHTHYSKMQVRLVNVGDTVTQGQMIGRVGRTGNSTGCHLHFEVWENNTPIDPIPRLPRF